MKKFYLSLFLLISVTISFGQTNFRKHTLSHLTKLDMGLFGLGFTVEPHISNNITIDLSTGFGGGYYIDKSTFEDDLLKLAWCFSATPKYFYSVKQTISHVKTAQNQSA